MFSNNDVREILQKFPPPMEASSTIPTLVLALEENAILTLPHLETTFKARVLRETQRISISSLASDLKVHQDIALKLVLGHSDLALLSSDSSYIVPSHELGSLHDKLLSLLSKGVVSKSEFAEQNDIALNSIDSLLRNLGAQIVNSHGYACTQSYETEVSEFILELLQGSLKDMEAVDIIPEHLVGTPPTWFVLRTLKNAMDMQNLSEKFHVQQDLHVIRCTPKQLTEKARDAVINDLRSGVLGYINLKDFWEGYPDLFAAPEDARRYIQNISEIFIIEAFVVSKVRISILEKECKEILQKNGLINLTDITGEFPETLQSRIAQDVEKSTLDSLEHSPEQKTSRLGPFIITGARRDKERSTLLDYAKADAATQWQQIKDNPDKEVKFDPDNISTFVTNKNLLQSSLLKEKSIEKELDDQFWATVTEQEVRNESEFAKFWLERVVSRFHVYDEGLNAVEDPKLRGQLAELLASYVQKELLPDSVSKARSQSLILSRKTRKNISKLETVLKAGSLDITGVVAALDKFNKKQNIDALAHSKGEVKKATIGDMIRRMQKQKQSDGPVLFLTLILILFARHYNGVVYATGKFAPKLLKQLKAVLDPKEYEQLEKWKEAAKASTLTAEERQDMKRMAEA